MTIQHFAELIEVGAMLATLLFFAALFRNRVQWGWLGATVLTLIAGSFLSDRSFWPFETPVFFAQLNYNWLSFLILGVVSLSIIAALPQGWRRCGVRLTHDGPGVNTALTVALALGGLLTAFALMDVFGQGPRDDYEAITFNLLAVSPSEELFFRGIVLALCLETFGARQTILRAELNWGLVPAALIFGFAHLTSTPGGETIAFNWAMTAYTSWGGLMLAWMRQASGSLALPIAVHGYGNAIQYIL